MACECRQNPACANRDWLQSVFDDCFVGISDGLMSGLMGAILVAGSKVRFGFVYELGWNETWGSSTQFVTYVQDVLGGALLGSGDFSEVKVSVTPSGYFGIQDGYILIEGTIYRDKGNPDHVADVAVGLIQEYLPEIHIKRRDAVIVDYVPPEQATRDDVAKVNTPPDTTPRGTTPGANPPSKCDWNNLDWDDYIACQLGIKTSDAALFGAGAALLGVIIITRLVK